MWIRLNLIRMTVMIFICFSIWIFIPDVVGAHCDTLDGPVVKDAKIALEKGDVTPVLKWVGKEHDVEVKEAFKKTMAVRGKGKEARELADMYFFETLVRIHRAGEGAPYTGLKPAGAVEPSIAEADKALESGSAEDLIKLITDAVAKGILERFTHTREAKRHKDESVEAGRRFVGTYVEFTHYVERLHLDATSKAVHHGGAEGIKTEDHQHH